MIPIGILTAAATTSFVGLLDLYPSAAAAYSLRKLRAAYTGSAIRVRRTDNTELDIGFVNNVLDTTTLLTFCGSGVGNVIKWYDQSGNTKDAANTLTTPQIVTGGNLITKNSKPSLLFGNGGFLDLNQKFTGSAGTYINVTCTNTDPPTINSGAPIDGIGVLQGTFQTFVDGNIYESFATSIRKTVGNPTPNTTNLYLYSAVSDANFFDCKINGSPFFNTTTNTVFYNSASFPRMGGGVQSPTSFFLGNVSELIIYTSNQNSNLSGINANINTFYTIY